MVITTFFSVVGPIEYFLAISGVAAPPPEDEAVASQRPKTLPTAEQLVAEMPSDPPVRILDARGHVLNRKAAPKWRNAASRNLADIQTELMQ